MQAVHRDQIKRWWYVLCVCVSILSLIFITWIAVICLRTLRINGITPRLIYELFSKKYVALNQTNNRTSLLILGVYGGHQKGSELSDIIAVTTINIQKKTISLIAVPPNIWSDTLKDTINIAYQYGEEKKEEGGLVLSKVLVEDVLGIPIHYVIKINFDGFKKIIDILEGIDITIQNGFTDPKYPIDNIDHENCPVSLRPSCLYTSVTFEQGLQRLNGERALMYARSRYSTNNEGSDFSRTLRQQEILLAVGKRISHPLSWFGFEKLRVLHPLLTESIQKDLTLGELISVRNVLKMVSNERINVISLDTVLESPNPALFADRSVLIPIESWKSIHEYIEKLIQ